MMALSFWKRGSGFTLSFVPRPVPPVKVQRIH
jgi:hypothetical protein